MSEQKQPTNADAVGGCLAMILLLFGGTFALVKCSEGGEEPPTASYDYCPDHRRAVQSAEIEVSRIKGIIATADAAATTGNASSLQGYFELHAEAREKLASAERHLKEAQRRYEVVCIGR